MATRLVSVVTKKQAKASLNLALVELVMAHVRPAVVYEVRDLIQKVEDGVVNPARAVAKANALKSQIHHA